MKTAEEYWNEHMAPAGLARFGDLSYDSRRHAAREMVAAIRADALAEKSVAPDADEERAKREFNAWRECHQDGASFAAFEQSGELNRKSWIRYSKTLPPRPVRSPGQRLFESERSVNHWSPSEEFASLSELTRNLFETRATALGIKPQE